MTEWGKGMEPRDEAAWEAGMAAGMEERLTRALEQRAAVSVPDEFAARVRAALPAAPRTRQGLGWGRTVAAVAVCVLLLAMVWLAGRSAPSFTNGAFDGELLLLVELGAVAWALPRWDQL